MRQTTTWMLTILGCSAVSACGGGGDVNTGPEVVVDTLLNGAVRLRYAALPAPVGEPAGIELSIGEMEGEAYEIFGDVRGIEADTQGNIYVLDFQASEIRAFGPDGGYLRTLTRKGAGPGELTAANGMILMPGDTLWVQDHGQMQNIALDLEGREITRFPIHVRNYGYMWNGTVDARGRFWKPTTHSDAPRVMPPPEGLNEGRSRSYQKWFDPGTGESDSVFLGEVAYRSFVAHNVRGGYNMRGIPFSTGGSVIVDPAGGFWHAAGDIYSVARLNAEGDTVLVIEADVAPFPVTDQDRQAYVDEAVERSPEERRLAEEVVALAPSTKPVLDMLTVDDEDRLWIRRVAAQGENPVFDVFTRGGEYLGSVRLGFQPSPYLSPRIRNDMFYALVRDSLDVPTVVRTTVPPLGVRPVVGEDRR